MKADFAPHCIRYCVHTRLASQRPVQPATLHDSPSRLRELLRDESGLFSISHVFTTLFLTAAVIVLFNVGLNLVDDRHTRQQADAAARSLGTWKARYLNAITAHHHHIGELTAMIAVHHAIGGDPLDASQASDTSRLDQKLRQAQQQARGCRTGTPAFEDVVAPVLAGKALLESHRVLKRLLTQVYQAKAIAMAMQLYPPTAAAGQALEQAAHGLEQAIHLEWKVLEQIRQRAVALLPIKRKLRDELLPEAKQQLDDLVAEYATTQSELVAHLESELGIRVHVLPSDTQLPVVEDPLARLMNYPEDWQRPEDCDCPSVAADNPRHQIAKTTQLARATFPWINYHRTPFVRRSKPLTPITHFSEKYFDHTNGVAKEFADLWQRQGELALYTLRGYEGPDKGFEPWMKLEGSAVADEMFGLTILVGTPMRSPLGSFLFGSAKQDYHVEYASAFISNERPSTAPDHRIDWYCKRIVPSTQAQVGYDLLGWSSENEMSELIGIGVAHVFPKIETNWRSSLTTTSAARVRQLAAQNAPDWASQWKSKLPGEFPEIFWGP